MRWTWRNRLTELRFFVPLDTKYVNFSETFPEPISWVDMKKLNLIQQKHTITNQTKCTTTSNKHKITKDTFSRLLRHPARKRRGPILVLALHKSVTYLLIHSTYLQPWTQTGPIIQVNLDYPATLSFHPPLAPKGNYFEFVSQVFRGQMSFLSTVLKHWRKQSTDPNQRHAHPFFNYHCTPDGRSQQYWHWLEFTAWPDRTSNTLLHSRTEQHMQLK